jgi:hypothetical protein
MAMLNGKLVSAVLLLILLQRNTKKLSFIPQLGETQILTKLAATTIPKKTSLI